MSPATAKVLDFVRGPAPLEDKLERIASDVDALEVLSRTNAQAQRATGDAIVAMDGRCERIEHGVLEALQGVGRIEKRLEERTREAQASGVDLAERVAEERKAREAEDERMRQMLAPVVADASRRAGNAGATKTAGAFSVAVLVAALVKEPVETIKVLREIGPTWAGVAVVLLLVVLAWARRRRS